MSQKSGVDQLGILGPFRDRLIWLPLGLLILALGMGCATSHPHEDDPSSLHEQNRAMQEVSDYKDLELLFQKNLMTSFQARVDHFAKQYPNSSYLPAIANFQGLYALKNKDFQQAISHFQHSIELSPSQSPFSQYVLYNLATAQLDAGLLLEALKTAESIQSSAMDKGNQIKVQYLKANIYFKNQLPFESARELLIASRWMPLLESNEQKKSFYDLLDQSLQAISSIQSLESLLKEFDDSPAADALLYHLGSREITTPSSATVFHPTEAGIPRLKSLMTRFPESTYYSKAAEWVTSKEVTPPKEGDSTGPADSRVIGVLLPTQGKFGRFGMKTLQGIQLALGIFNSDSSHSDLTLVIEDSGEEPEQAIAALERLVNKHKAVGIIGPMMSKGLEQVTQKAHQLGVPMITLARRSAPSQDYVINGGLTQQLQTYELVKYAIQNLGQDHGQNHDPDHKIKRFAVVYPNDKAGIEMAHSFWDAVESLGGRITGFESYSPGETDFRKVVDRLSGLAIPETRQRELDLLAQERETNNIKKRTRKTEQYFKLKPIVDFDAVFIADDPKVAGQIIPTFAYRDIENVKFLGNSSWNSSEFISRTQNHGEAAFFTALFSDAFYQESDLPSSREFLQSYKSTFNQDPSSMEAIAFDAATAFKLILTQSSTPITRADLKAKLNQLESYPGVGGDVSIKDGTLLRRLRILTVRNGKIAEAEQSG